MVDLRARLIGIVEYGLDGGVEGPPRLCWVGPGGRCRGQRRTAGVGEKRRNPLDQVPDHVTRQPPFARTWTGPTAGGHRLHPPGEHPGYAAVARRRVVG